MRAHFRGSLPGARTPVLGGGGGTLLKHLHGGHAAFTGGCSEAQRGGGRGFWGTAPVCGICMVTAPPVCRHVRETALPPPQLPARPRLGRRKPTRPGQPLRSPAGLTG